MRNKHLLLSTDTIYGITSQFPVDIIQHGTIQKDIKDMLKKHSVITFSSKYHNRGNYVKLI